MPSPLQPPAKDPRQLPWRSIGAGVAIAALVGALLLYGPATHADSMLSADLSTGRALGSLPELHALQDASCNALALLQATFDR